MDYAGYVPECEMSPERLASEMGYDVGGFVTALVGVEDYPRRINRPRHLRPDTSGAARSVTLTGPGRFGTTANAASGGVGRRGAGALSVQALRKVPRACARQSGRHVS